MRKDEKPSFLQNLVFYLGCVILVGLMGYLIFQIFNDGSLPADLKAMIRSIPGETCGYEITIDNEGDTTAENVRLVIDLYGDGLPVDRATVSIDYIPISSSRSVRVLFDESGGDCDSVHIASMAFLVP